MKLLSWRMHPSASRQEQRQGYSQSLSIPVRWTDKCCWMREPICYSLPCRLSAITGKLCGMRLHPKVKRGQFLKLKFRKQRDVMWRKLLGILTLFSFLPYFRFARTSFGKMAGIISCPDRRTAFPESLS